ncbi:MAG: magnesium/cobalt transporter CorA [Chitinophagales bacterium]|nr:magnesium/cobalt transporter CorA [Bacteroidota bacterium]
MLRLIQYNETEYFKQKIATFEELISLLKDDRVQWIDVETCEQAIVEQICQYFGIHHLIVEDILNVKQMPKAEMFENYLFLAAKMLYYPQTKSDEFQIEHISFVLIKQTVISFQQFPVDVFDEVRKRITDKIGRIRFKKADYLFYRLNDTLVDKYIEIVYNLERKLNELEEEINENAKRNEVITQLIALKSDINSIRRIAMPLYSEFVRIKYEVGTFFHKHTFTYLQDLCDHLLYVQSSCDNFKEVINDLMQLYFSFLSQDTNNVMRILTVFSTIFMPLSFLVGVYGMNFKYMPELEWKWAYPMLWVIMIFIGLIMTWYVKRKYWL